jgi:hypothetical protein
MVAIAIEVSAGESSAGAGEIIAVTREISRRRVDETAAAARSAHVRSPHVGAEIAMHAAAAERAGSAAHDCVPARSAAADMAAASAAGCATTLCRNGGGRHRGRP